MTVTHIHLYMLVPSHHLPPRPPMPLIAPLLVISDRENFPRMFHFILYYFYRQYKKYRVHQIRISTTYYKRSKQELLVYHITTWLIPEKLMTWLIYRLREYVNLLIHCWNIMQPKIPLATLSRMKWTSISICFLRLWTIGLVAIYIELRLS